MASSTATNGPEEPRYINFPSIEHGTVRDGAPVLNRWSATITKGHDFPGAQVRTVFPSGIQKKTADLDRKAMLYAAGVPNRETMKTAPHVGISTVW
jgi:dihydroxy-acid dehydratase